MNLQSEKKKKMCMCVKKRVRESERELEGRRDYALNFFFFLKGGYVGVRRFAYMSGLYLPT